MRHAVDASENIMRVPAPRQPSQGRPAHGQSAVLPLKELPPDAAPRPNDKAPPLDVTCSRQFTRWMAEQRLSIAFTTYQAAKLFLVGLQPNGKLSMHKRTLPRCMGMMCHGNSLYVSSLWQLWRFENIVEPGAVRDGFDRVYVPQVGYVTGDVDVHDMAIDRHGRLIFVNTLFACLATVSETHSFQPLWQPPFISKLAAEDRCHLNGLAMRDGVPAYVTAVSEGDVMDGWRDFRRDGGVVIDVAENEVILRGLSMPHSPRWYRDRLWLHNSGTGELGWVDLAAGKFQPLCFLPGYLRGLDFVGDFAVVGLSKPRENKEFTGLELQDRLAGKKAVPHCGLAVIDLRSGDAVHWLRMEGAVQELYDVAILRHCRRPMAIGFMTDEIRRVLRVPPIAEDKREGADPGPEARRHRLA